MYKIALLFAAFSIVFASKEFKGVEPVALVKYKDTVYQCEDVAKTPCGHSIHCGEIAVHCAENLVIEYL